ncbi:MAG TPA: ATP-binding protein, partial [Candidatus Polarisedimenticolaceae bacterium]|nr:ATP-binding protein [Candidatus Polarisedimenticolaceae bacterium]
ERLTLEIEPLWNPRPEPYLYLSIVGLAFWVSGLFIAIKWPLIRGGAVYGLFSMAMFAQLILSHSGRADVLDAAINWGDLIAGALAPALLLHLGVVLSKGVVNRRVPWVAATYGVATIAMMSAVWIRPDAAGGAYRFSDPLLMVEAHQRLGPLWLSVCWLSTTVLLIRSFHNSSSVMHRSQLRWVLWGLVVGIGPFVLFYAVPWTLGAPELPAWAEFLAIAPMIVVPGAFATALARYRLHDLDLILLRGITEASAVFGTFAVLAATIFILREGLAGFLPLSRSATRYVGFLVAAVSYPQMRAWARAGIERAFYRRRYSYRTTLLDWARELSAETDLWSLLTRLRERVRDTLGIDHAAVLLRIEDNRFDLCADRLRSCTTEIDAGLAERLETQPYVTFEAGTLPDLPWASYLFSIRVKDQLRAVLAVCERRQPEDPLNTEDRALLGTLAAHAATAIEAARLFLEVRERADEIGRLHATQAKILESSAVGLLLLDGQGKIQAWNRALEAIYGLERREAIGRGLREVFPFHVVRRLEREAGLNDSVEEARLFRLSMVNHAGRRILANVSISPADGETGDDGSRVITFDDVTEQVELEDQVLRQERLASLGLLAAGVAHEINTPLTGISSYTQLLMDELDPDDRRRAVLEKIEQQTQRAAGITGSLLNLARPANTAAEPIDVNRLIGEVIQLFEPQVRRTGIRLTTSLSDGLPRIAGNRGKLQQVVLNLLINARDALGQRGTIAVATRGVAGGGVAIDVTDDGPGIADDDLPRIFDPFFTTKGRSKGTGLGLSISYGIVREHDGQIHVESRPDRFTRFRVELPAIRSAEAIG